MKQLEEQEAVISKARQLFVADKLKFDDFSELKTEYQTVSDSLKKELGNVTVKLTRIEQQFKLAQRHGVDIFFSFQDLDAADKKQIVSFMPPVNVDKMGNISIQISYTLSKILSFKSRHLLSGAAYVFDKMNNADPKITNFTDRKISVKRATVLLAKNEIQVDDKEAAIILSFLYHIAKSYNRRSDKKHQLG